MAHTANKLVPFMAILASFSAPLPSIAGLETGSVFEETRRLNQRVELLGKSLKHSKEKEVNRGAGAREKEIVSRLEDIERQVIIHDKNNRQMDALEGISVEASLLMVGQHALSGTTNGKDESRLNYRGDGRLACRQETLARLRVSFLHTFAWGKAMA